MTGGKRAARRIVAVIAIAVAMMSAAIAPATADGARYFGSAEGGAALNRPIVGITASPSGNGYWLVASDGGIFAFGDATFHGSTGAMKLNSPIVGLAPTPTAAGYWLVARDGGIFAFGDARFFGSTGAMKLNSPIVGMAPSSTGRGYLLVAADGGIFAFGDARFFGSTGATKLNSPIVGMAPSSTGRGYLLVAADGGIFAFGDASFSGSAGGLRLGSPVIGITMNPRGPGYWLATAAGGVLGFGGAPLFGTSGAGSPRGWTVGMASPSSVSGYWLVNTAGGVATFGPEQRPLSDTLRGASNSGSAIARELFARVNEERAARGLDPLVWDERLAGRAAAWAAEMARSGFRHQLRDGVMPDAPDYRSRYDALGENLYWGSGPLADAGDAHAALMASETHRENIAQPGFTAVGIGAYCAPDGKLWITEDFGAWRGWPAPGLASNVPPAVPVARPDTAGPHC